MGKFSLVVAFICFLSLGCQIGKGVYVKGVGSRGIDDVDAAKTTALFFSVPVYSIKLLWVHERWYPPTWDAEYAGRAYRCTMKSILEPASVDCEETRASKADTAERIVVDRLKLDSNCPATGIEIVAKSDWINGTERTFRIKACGSFYICSVAVGRADCKLASVQ